MSRAATTGGPPDVRAMPIAALCVKCAVPTPGGKLYCGPCGEARNKRRQRDPEARREADRRCYAERRARGDCTSCGKPANGAAECEAYCAPCTLAKEARRNPEAEQAARRRRYAERRAKGRCVECNTPSPGVARCEPCSRKHREGSGAFRGIPVWDPTWTVIEVETGREHGPFDSESDIALCLAFEKLDRDRVEIVTDASPMASLTSWS